MIRLKRAVCFLVSFSLILVSLPIPTQGGTFETDPDFQKELDWIAQFVHEEVEPLEHVLGSPYDVQNPRNQKLVRPLQAEVKNVNCGLVI